MEPDKLKKDLEVDLVVYKRGAELAERLLSLLNSSPEVDEFVSLMAELHNNARKSTTEP